VITLCLHRIKIYHLFQLNTAKTEILWSTTGRRSHQLPQLPLRVGTDKVTPASVVRDVGIYIDSDVSMRIDYKLTLLVYKCRQGVTPPYLADELCQPADTKARCRLRSASASSLVVRHTRLSTVGDRALPVAAPRIWNSLPQHVASAPSLAIFCSRLKTHLFRRYFP